MPFTKPDVNTIWAATGEVISPATAKVAQGWVAEIPDYEFENWIQNRQDRFNAHVNQYGMPVWDSTTEYIANKSYVQGSDGEIYRALTTHTNSDPTVSTVNWVKAFDNFDTSYSKAEANDTFLNEANNLSDLTNNATARTNLNVYSKSESDGRYLLKSNNLSGLTDLPTARTNLGVYSKTEVYAKAEGDDRYLLESNNLSDLTNNATARTNLNVYSKSESDTRYQDISPLVGMVVPFAANTAPDGWLKCDGSAVSRSTYIALFNRIGTTYGTGDGSTTFNLPDLRGEFIRGWDDGRGVDTGRTFGSAQSGAIESHNHTASTDSAGSHSHTGSALSAGSHNHLDGIALNPDYNEIYGSAYYGSTSYNLSSTRTSGRQSYTSSAGSHTHSLSINSGGSHSHTVTVNSTGGSETRPRNIAMLYCIKH